MSGSPPVAQRRTITPELDSRRTSSLISSSAASFHTAPSLQSHPSFHSDASSGSIGTVAPIAHKNLDANPLHLLSQASQEIHVVEVSGDKVELHSGHTPGSLLQRGENSVARVVSCEPAAPAGPPPPSPPPSVERDDDNEKQTPFLRPTPSHQMHYTHSEPPQSRLVANDFALARQQSSTSSSSDGIPARTSSLQGESSFIRLSHDGNKSRSSFETRLSARTGQSSVSGQSCTPMTSVPASAPPSKSSHTSMDGYLQPPSPVKKKPARRNTTGSSTPSSSTSRPSRAPPTVHRHQSTILPQQQYAFEDSDVYTAANAQMLGVQGELASDIMAQAHQIRRERESKRRHQEEQDAEAEKLGVKGDGMQVIGEGHVNYVLMYNMLSGIRTCVRICPFIFLTTLTASHRFHVAVQKYLDH